MSSRTTGSERRKIRSSFDVLAAQAEEDHDFESADLLRKQLEEREGEWLAQDEYHRCEARTVMERFQSMGLIRNGWTVVDHGQGEFSVRFVLKHRNTVYELSEQNFNHYAIGVGDRDELGESVSAVE